MLFKTRYILLLTLALACLPALRGASIRISCSGGGRYAVGQQFAFIVSMEDVNGNVSVSRNIPGCAYVGVNQSSSFTSVTTDGRGNARMTSSKTMEIVVQATQPGTYTFGPVSAGGVRSNTVSYEISGSAAAKPAPSSVDIPGENSDVIIRASVSDKNPYVQQGVVYDVTMYTRVAVNWPQLNYPKFENCTYELVPDNQTHDFRRVTLNGKDYMALDLYSMIVYPSKAGKAVLAGGDAVVPLPPFDEARINVNDIEIDVRDLPGISEHKDVNGVGEYDVSMQLLSKAVRTGEAAKVRFTIKGKGNPAFVSLPDNLGDLLPAGFKLLKSESEIKKDVTASGVTATINFDCYVIPSKAGDYEIPSLTFTFFNPGKGEWYTRSTDAVQISVAQGSQAHEGDDSLVFDSALQDTGDVAESHTYFISSLVYWLCYMVPLVALVLVLVLYRRRLELRSDPGLMKHRLANSVARRRLRAAASAMKKGDADRFYDETLKAVWGYLGDKLGIPTSDLARDNINVRLLEAGVSGAVAEDAISFIDDCEFAKYGSSAGGDMQQTYDRAARLIDTLETELKTSSQTNQKS